MSDAKTPGDSSPQQSVDQRLTEGAATQNPDRSADQILDDAIVGIFEEAYMVGLYAEVLNRETQFARAKEAKETASKLLGLSRDLQRLKQIKKTETQHA